jgi:hypothetical protein
MIITSRPRHATSVFCSVFAGLLVAAAVAACGGTTPVVDDADEDLTLAKPCGGFAGLRCAGGTTCVDDPRDSCNPASGGRDCGGLCITATKAKTCGGFAGLVCGTGKSCVDDPRDSCDPAAGGRDCSGLCVAGVAPAPAPTPTLKTCGGFAGLRCSGTDVCVDDPRDTCDPNKGGADCSGVCVVRATAKICGGIIGAICAATETCVDDPADQCNPAKGGADCTGFCVAKK